MIELIKIQAELKAPKNQYNNFGQYHYRNTEGILESVKPLLLKYGCLLLLDDQIIEVAGRVYVKATATIKSGDESVKSNAFAREEETKKGMDAAQITGSASSYARKHALNALFLIDDTKDPDSTNIHGEESGKTEPAISIKDAKYNLEKCTIKKELSDLWGRLDKEGQVELKPLFTAKKESL